MKTTNKNSSFSEHHNSRLHTVSLALLLATAPTILFSQNVNNESEDEVEVFTLSPFTVEGSKNEGYRATSTLAGTRISSNLEDVGSSISVLTEEFLDDIGAVDNETALAYALGTEVGGPRGNFTGIDPANDVDQNTINEEGAFLNSNSNTRVRGLESADNTRNFFRTNTPWDGYNVNRIDIQRGPNAMLFGLGSPAGVINATTHGANLTKKSGEIEFRTDRFGSMRLSGDYNVPIIEDQLALRFSVLNDEQIFRRSPAYEDDKRLFVAFKYAPKILNNDKTRFEVSGSYENGDIESNRPRSLAPYDYVTQFFEDAAVGGNDRGTVDLTTVEGRIFQNGVPNLSGLFERGVQFSTNSNIGVDFIAQGLHNRGFRNRNGAITTNNIFGRYTNYVPSDRLTWANANSDQLTDEQKLWLSVGNFATNTFQDPNIYDFFNLQFDGPNKKEFQNWNAKDLEISNTYLNNKLGFNLSFHREDVEQSRYSLLNTNNHRIYIDMMETLLDLDIESGEVTASPNPNLGRAFIQHTMGGSTSNTYITNEAARFSAYADIDIRDYNDGFIGRLLGKHRFNYAFEDQSSEGDRRNQRPGAFGQDFYDRVTPTRNFNQFDTLVNFRQYVSDDLRNITSIDQIKINNVEDDLFAASAGLHTVRFFDPTWIAGNIFGNSWTDPNGVTTTQSQNPENYAGWTTESFNFYNMSMPDVIVDGTNMTTRDYLTIDARAESEDIKSHVLVLQSNFWNDSIIGTYGYREDTSDTYLLRAPTGPTGGDDLSPELYGFGLENGEYASDKGSNTNWSVAAHINRILGSKDNLPFKITVYYNEGENTSPGSVSSKDIFNDPIPKRSGETVDKSVQISTKDNKYSIRITDYETSFKNAQYGLGSDFLIQQSFTTPARYRSEMRSNEFNEDLYVANGGDLTRLYDVIVPAWDAFAQTLESDPQFDGLIDNWFENGTLSNFMLEDIANGVVATQMTIRGALTRDTVSRGTEFEFTANPIDNLRIAINGSRTKATIDNAPGDAYKTFIDFVDDAMMNTAVGEMPAEGEADTIRNSRWLSYRGIFVPSLALNGKAAPEIRKWRYNAIANYSFTDGKFKGLGIGGAFRHQDPQILEYALKRDESGIVVPDLEKPFKGPKDDSIDLWASYRRTLSDSIDWSIQLNVYNAFGENEAIPLNVDPDGTPNAIRVQEGTSWSLSNTFKF